MYAYNVFYLFKRRNCLSCWGAVFVNLGEISMHYLISKEQSFQVSRLKAVKKPNIYHLLKCILPAYLDKIQMLNHWPARAFHKSIIK